MTANRKGQYLMNPQFASTGAATDRPCFTLIARMDKRPPRLVTAEADGEELPSFIRLEDETLVYEIYPEDTPMLVQIKEFMALYGLVDIRMRMLRIPDGTGSLRGAGGETLRVEHRAAAVCGVKFVFFPSHINIPAGASWPGRDLL